MGRTARAGDEWLGDAVGAVDAPACGRGVPLRGPREEFLKIFGAGVLLVIIGTLSFALVDSFYFTVSTLTTTSVADPDLVLDHRWVKVFAVLFQLIGIGVLVEILRRLGMSFVEVRKQEH